MTARLDPDLSNRVATAARQVLAQNRRQGTTAWAGPFWEQPLQPAAAGQAIRYDFVCPSNSAYPFQWFWDSCFHAIALSRVDVALAEREVLGLLAAARGDGFIPHMILWERDAHEAVLASYNISLSGRHTTATIQPPVLAQAVERVYLAGRHQDFLETVLPYVQAYHAWLAAHRDPDGAGLIAILQPDESGMDAAPKYDHLLGLADLNDPGLCQAMQRLTGAYRSGWHDHQALLRLCRFAWVDCLVNACYLQAQAAEARLLEAAGRPGPAAAVRARRAAGLRSLIERCWDQATGAFFDYYLAPETGDRVAVPLLSISSLMPLVLEDLPREIVQRLVEDQLLNETEFWLPYGLPSVAASEPSFEPDYRSGLIWRGPTWVNTNWFLVQALRQHDYGEAAVELTARTVAMLARGGIREFFNPYTAEGYGAQGFGWSTLVLDLLPNS